MTMTYQEALDDNPTITKADAKRLCRDHSVPFVELLAELGDHETYQARDVLHWLGY